MQEDKEGMCQEGEVAEWKHENGLIPGQDMQRNSGGDAGHEIAVLHMGDDLASPITSSPSIDVGAVLFEILAHVGPLCLCR